MSTGSDGNAGAWSQPSTVAGFASGSPNQSLIAFANDARLRAGTGVALDIGCGAGRNAVPLARLGWDVIGLDLSMPMLAAAMERARAAGAERHCRLVLSTMDRLPIASGSCDLVIAHGIWNLARSAAEFRLGIAEAARVAKAGAALFVFTFSRSTLRDDAEPVADEPFVYTASSSEPQVFLTRQQLIEECAAAGFVPDPALPLEELNRRRPGMLAAAGSPVIWQGVFRHE